ncbi:hypothetical protein KSF78_0000842 [Schistosoma japonicum]|nr:hypothetical protein KSF78_0000842 [Schistosoma japonicum]
MTSSFHAFNVIAMICSLYLLITKIYCSHQTNPCDFLKSLESKCLIKAFDKIYFLSKIPVEEYNISDITQDDIGQLIHLCKMVYRCTLPFTECIRPYFDISECDIDSLFIRKCQSFHIPFEGGNDTEKFDSNV